VYLQHALCAAPRHDPRLVSILFFSASLGLGARSETCSAATAQNQFASIPEH